MSKYSPGIKFNKLTILEYIDYKNRKVECACGNVYITSITAINNNINGCAKCYKPKSAVEKFTTHGFSKHRIYGIWVNMKTRCLGNKNTKNYKDRGIKICKEWLDFIRFKDWAFNNGYKNNLTIERINNNGNYEPGNCKWIPKGEQALNRRCVKKFNFNGELLTLREIGEKIGVKRSTMDQRYYVYHWPIEKIITYKKGGQIGIYQTTRNR